MNQFNLRILFLTDDLEDYLADGILHGLRQLSYVDLIDYPRKECMYEGGRQCKSAPHLGVRGGGFTLYGLLIEHPGEIDRGHIWRRLEAGLFDAVIISNIWRQWGLLIQLRKLLSGFPLIILDGEDDQRFFPLSATKVRQFGIFNGLANLLRSPTTYIFKREITQSSTTWPWNIRLNPISFSVPSNSVLNFLPNKIKLFPTHIIDSEVRDYFGGSDTYAFDDEAQYRYDLSSARFGITTRRAGWDCLRHYEIASCGTIVCFRDLNKKLRSCAPHGLIHGFNCLNYNSVDDLLAKINCLSSEQESAMQYAALNWATSQSTSCAAARMLKVSGLVS